MVQRVDNFDLAELRARLNQRPGPRVDRERPPLFSSANLDRHYRPLRGLLCSIGVHGTIVAALIVLPIALGAAEDLDLEAEAVILRVDELDDVVYLPLLGNAELKPQPEPRAAVDESKPARSKEGLSYPGPQPIFSDPPDATNHTQTLLQPAHANVPILQAFMLPNLVRMSEPARLPAPVAESRFKAVDTSDPMARATTAATPFDVSLSDSIRRLAPPIAESKLRLPESSVAVGPSTAAALPDSSVALNSTVGAPIAPPKPAEPTEKKSAPAQDLLALSPTPARADQPVVIPPGETRGRFAISPQPNLSFPGLEPGTKANDKDTASPSPSTTANDKPAEGSPKTPAGFQGITILGGIDAPAVPRNSNPQPLQTSYGITILSSGGSGGGLRDFGVFGNEQVQTVYLDMRRTISDRPLSWTTEYAVGQKEIVAVNGVVNISIRQEVVLPFPITKELPVWPEELAQKFAGKMVTAFAIITDEGKVEQVTVMDSPDPQLNDVVLAALRKWTFRPARRDGEPVSAKLLLGIPVIRLD